MISIKDLSDEQIRQLKEIPSNWAWVKAQDWPGIDIAIELLYHMRCAPWPCTCAPPAHVHDKDCKKSISKISKVPCTDSDKCDVKEEHLHTIATKTTWECPPAPSAEIHHICSEKICERLRVELDKSGYFDTGKGNPTFPFVSGSTPHPEPLGNAGPAKNFMKM